MNRRRSRLEVIALQNLLKKKFALSVGSLKWLGDWKHHITKFAIALKVFEAGLIRNLNSFTTTNERKNHQQMECHWFDLRRLKKL